MDSEVRKLKWRKKLESERGEINDSTREGRRCVLLGLGYNSRVQTKLAIGCILYKKKDKS